jgi:hypothetical protein
MEAHGAMFLSDLPFRRQNKLKLDSVLTQLITQDNFIVFSKKKKIKKAVPLHAMKAPGGRGV